MKIYKYVQIESLPSDVKHIYDNHKHSNDVHGPGDNEAEDLHPGNEESKQSDLRILNKVVIIYNNDNNKLYTDHTNQA